MVMSHNHLLRNHAQIPLWLFQLGFVLTCSIRLGSIMSSIYPLAYQDGKKVGAYCSRRTPGPGYLYIHALTLRSKAAQASHISYSRARRVRRMTSSSTSCSAVFRHDKNTSSLPGMAMGARSSNKVLGSYGSAQ